MQAVWTEYYARLVVFVSLFFRGTRVDSSKECEDVVQEIMEKVVLNLHRYNPRYSFNTWIYSIARNHCRDVTRKRTVRSRVATTIEVESLAARTEGPEELLVRKEEERITERFMASLSEGERQVAFLRFSEGMTYEEIGRILGMPSGTVKYRIHEIRKGLENALETDTRQRTR